MLTRPLVSLVLLAAWLGAAGIVASVVAPAAFAVLPTRALAGALVGRVLPVVFGSGIVVGLATAVLSWLGRGEGVPSRIPLIGGAAMAIACAVAQLAIAPRIARLRAEIGPSIEALAADDARRLAFGRLHAFSVLWLGVAMVAAVVAVVAIFLVLRARR